MNKIFTTAILGLMAIPAFAIPNPIPTASELPVFDEFGENITVPSYQDRVIYRYTPSTPGIMTVLSVTKSSDMDLFVSEIYDSSNYTVLAERWHLGTFMDNPPAGYNFGYEYNMTPDQVYYISIPLTSFNSATEVKFLWEEREVSPSAITSILPDPTNDFFYDYLTEQNIVVQADGPMTSFGEVTISYLDQVVPIRGNRKSGPANGEFLTIATADPGSTNYVLPAVEAGADSFTITVKDYKVNGLPVTGNATGIPEVIVEEGTVSFSYKLTKAPAYMASESTWPATFYSSWEKGDPAGMATLVFDQPISFVGEATLIMAAYTLGEIGGENTARTYPLKPVVEGNKVIIDFTGTEYIGTTSIVSVFVMNARGENGLPSTFEEYNTAMVVQMPFVNEAAPENPDIPGTPEGPKYMEKKATQVNEEISEFDSAVELRWGETVTIVDADAIEIPVSFGGKVIGSLSSTYINLVGSGTSDPASISPRAETGESGTTMFLLLGAAGLLQESGLYTLTLPEGMVENADGAINRSQLVAVIYSATAEGTVTPESGTEFAAGENVIITIAFDGVVEQNYTPDAPVMVTNYEDYEVQLNWTPDVVYIEGNAIVINLGAELEEGTYYLSLREGVVVVDGSVNAPIFDYMFKVAGTGSVESINAEKGVKEIYNLNGVKVNENNIGQGFYIINGKKVFIRK